MKIDTTRLLEGSDIVTVVGNHVPLKKKGSEFVGICPFHADSSPSLHVNRTKQVYGCFACGVGGDSIDFLMRLGLTFKDACNEIAGGDVSNPKPVEKRKAKEATKAVKWKQAQPTEPANDIRHYRHGKPSRKWGYHTATGELLGYITRFDLPDGTKEVLPYVYATDGNRHEWRFQAFDNPRPLYNLDKLTARPTATVIVVEGEKTAEAAEKLLPNAIITCWQGGSNAIAKTDWTPLQGRRVLLWPDNDWSHRYGEKHQRAGRLKPFHEQPGNKAMLEIADLIRPMGASVKWIKNPEQTPCGWDVADATWSAEETQVYVRASMIDVPEIPAEEFEPEQVDDLPPPPPPLPPVEDYQPDVVHDDQPFRILGYSKDGNTATHHFYSDGSKTVISLSASAMTKSNLLELAPMSYWETNYPKKGGFEADAAMNYLIGASQRKGIFSDKYVRGRGVWIEDDKTVVIHNGHELVVNGKRMPLTQYVSKYIYECSEPLGLHSGNALQSQDAAKLMDVLRLLNWERDINAYLLAGWCVIAPICGALSWRPHIWLTGAAGTGKSWVFKNIVRRLLGDTGLAVQGETSEPGLRQLLGHDALPVVFDEAEGEDRRSQERMQAVLALMRAASADDGGIMAKGTSGGTAKTYRIRSSFAFASISVQLSQQSDRTRVSVLGLRRAIDKDKDERWKKLQRDYHSLITDEWVKMLHSRTVSLIPVILENSRTFATAAAMVIGEQRAGDQLGALLAGAYSLHSTKTITLEDAVKWVEARDWNEEKGLDVTRDEFALLSYLLEQTITIETSSGRYDRTVAEAVGIAHGVIPDSIITNDSAAAKLRRCGFKIDGDYLAISNTSDWVLKRLEGKQWAKNHNKILLRIEQSKALESTRFGPGLKARAVGVPLALLFDNA